MNLDPTRLTDVQARNLVLAALRRARASYRAALTAGDLFNRELERLLKRRTRINAHSLSALSTDYDSYLHKTEALQVALTDAYNTASQF